jgi:hypothetical protein
MATGHGADSINEQRIKSNAYKLAWYYSTNRKEYAKKWYASNIELHRKNRRENNKKRRLELISLLGGKCVQCGFSDTRALQIDHINGGGSKERKGYGHSASSLKQKVENSIKQDLGEYQLLCANCNWIKREEKMELFNV